MAVEPRTPTSGQLNELSPAMSMPGAGNGSSPATMIPMARSGPAADALSTETRSTVTAATNGTGGVDQEIGKTTRRRSPKAKPSRPNNRTAAAPTAAALGTPVGVSPAGMGVAMGSGMVQPLTQTVPTGRMMVVRVNW